MRAPQSNPRSPHDVATARMYQRRKQLGLPRREACASARILKFVTFTLGTDPPRFAPPQKRSCWLVSMMQKRAMLLPGPSGHIVGPDGRYPVGQSRVFLFGT